MSMQGGGGTIVVQPQKKNFFCESLDNLSTYGHIMLKFTVDIFTGWLQYFPKNKDSIKKMGG